MAEKYDIISQLGPQPHAGWVPLFPNATNRWSELDKPMITDIIVANVTGSAAAWSLSYGNIFDPDSTVANMINDNIRFNAIAISGNTTVIVAVRWPFASDVVQLFCKSSVSSALTFLAVGVKGLP